MSFFIIFYIKIFIIEKIILQREYLPHKIARLALSHFANKKILNKHLERELLLLHGVFVENAKFG